MVGLFVGLPALLFSAITLVVLLTSRPSGSTPTDGFPRLRPQQEPVNNNSLLAGPPEPTQIDPPDSPPATPDNPPATPDG